MTITHQVLKTIIFCLRTWRFPCHQQSHVHQSCSQVLWRGQWVLTSLNLKKILENIYKWFVIKKIQQSKIFKKHSTITFIPKTLHCRKSIQWVKCLNIILHGHFCFVCRKWSHDRERSTYLSSINKLYHNSVSALYALSYPSYCTVLCTVDNHIYYNQKSLERRLI